MEEQHNMIYVLNGSFWFPLETEWLRSKSGSREGGGCVGGYCTADYFVYAV